MKLYFESYGCTLNRGEAEKVKEIVMENGHFIEEDIENSEIIIIFTCTVIETTERKMLKRLKGFSKLKKRVIVSGCMASIQRNKVKEIIPDIEFLNPNNLTKITNLIGQEKFIELKKPMKLIDSIAIVPIANGCLGKCSYCITRLARGKLNSRSIEDIVKDVKNAVDKGLMEIQITAQDSGCYGIDIGKNLPELIKNITQIENDFRIRIGMMNPNQALSMLEDLLDVYENEKVFKFLHLPLQSGDSEVLKIMNRNYMVEDFEKIVNNFRKKFMDFTLSTDIIVGFPNEDEEKFQNTVDLITKIKPDSINITRFSPRSGTKANKMKAPHSRITKERSRILTKLRFELSKEINKKNVGKIEKVLITEIGKGQTVIGRTQSYKQVVIDENLSLGEFIKIRIIKAENTYLFGELA